MTGNNGGWMLSMTGMNKFSISIMDVSIQLIEFTYGLQ